MTRTKKSRRDTFKLITDVHKPMGIFEHALDMKPLWLLRFDVRSVVSRPSAWGMGFSFLDFENGEVA